MWIPKTNEELEIKKSKKYSFKDIVLAVLLTALFFLIKILFHDFLKYGKLKLDNNVLTIALMSAITAILFYKFISLFHKKENSEEKNLNERTTVVCINCNKLKSFDNIHICECGGRFELLSKMKWVE